MVPLFRAEHETTDLPRELERRILNVEHLDGGFVHHCGRRFANVRKVVVDVLVRSGGARQQRVATLLAFEEVPPRLGSEDRRWERR